MFLAQSAEFLHPCRTGEKREGHHEIAAPPPLQGWPAHHSIVPDVGPAPLEPFGTTSDFSTRSTAGRWRYAPSEAGPRGLFYWHWETQRGASLQASVQDSRGGSPLHPPVPSRNHTPLAGACVWGRGHHISRWESSRRHPTPMRSKRGAR